jgi:DNA-binding transcriptional MocR family regulator
MAMTEWRPRIETGPGLIPDRILAALKADIAAGLLAPNARLPTHRRLAELLGVSVGAVTRAYAEAELSGLVTAHVGRGSFVAGAAGGRSELADDDGPIDLGRNVAPSAEAEAKLSKTFARLRRRGDLGAYLDYPPPAGFEAQRKAGAVWLSRTGGGADIDWRRLICTSGAQQAIAIALAAACRPGDAVVVEAATFTGVKALAAHMAYRLVGAAMDAEGLTPEALEAAAAASGARVAYVQPLQNPTGRIMSLERRRAIVDVARRRGLMLVEDDLYGAYAAEFGLPTLASLAPERVFHVSGLSKSLTPGLRIGYCVTPEGGGWMEAALGALRAIAFGPPGLGGLVACQWIEDGTADAILRAHRAALAERAALALSLLGQAAEPPLNRAATHLWLPMGELEAERSAARALRGGVQVSPPTAALTEGSTEHGLRVCLGGAPSLATLERGLRILAVALEAGDERTLGMV